jgi:hypothetical protein
MIEPSRRGFITGLISFAVTAPAIVRATSLMPVKLMEPELTIEQLLRRRIADAERVMQERIKTILYGDRYFGISGESNNVYVSEPLPFKLDGIGIVFDRNVPNETVYLFSENAVAVEFDK